MKKLEAVYALVEIREYLRGLDENKEIPKLICDDFNIVAKQLGVTSENWCNPNAS